MELNYNSEHAEVPILNTTEHNIGMQIPHRHHSEVPNAHAEKLKRALCRDFI